MTPLEVEVRRFAFLPTRIDGHGLVWLRHYFVTEVEEPDDPTGWGSPPVRLRTRIDPDDGWWFRRPPA